MPTYLYAPSPDELNAAIAAFLEEVRRSVWRRRASTRYSKFDSETMLTQFLFNIVLYFLRMFLLSEPAFA